MADICDELSGKFTPEKPVSQYKGISTEEKGICYRVRFDPPRQAVIFRVDGCIICSGPRCDKLLLSQKISDPSAWVGHFIELKGTDINHAIEQLEVTIENPVFKNRTLVEKHARIVARSIPSSRANPNMEKARIRFITKYACELKTLKSQNPEVIRT